MKKLVLVNLNPGSYSLEEKQQINIIKTFNNKLIELTENQINIYDRNDRCFNSDLLFLEEDSITKTYRGQFDGNVQFRLIRPNGIARIILEKKNEIDFVVFGSLSGDGYALHFELHDVDYADVYDFNTSQDLEFISASESKAEALVLLADDIVESDSSAASGYITRFLKLVENNDVDILKFEFVENLMYGYLLAINLSFFDENEAQNKLAKLGFRFYSTHLRVFNNGKEDFGYDDGIDKLIEIVPNYTTRQDYIVTIYNKSSSSTEKAKDIHFSSLIMKVIKISEDEIVMKDYESSRDDLSNSQFEIKLHMLDFEVKNVELVMIEECLSVIYCN
jgi:hypothetical protein